MCPCGSEEPIEKCCLLYIGGAQYPTTAEALMRSRYTAYVLANAKYVLETTHPRRRHLYSKKSILQWATENEWTGLIIVNATVTTVTFKASFTDANGVEHQHKEHSLFEALGDKLYYVSGTFED
ncbi:MULTISPECIES: YchJ family protein [unclassified Myroides]|uniref:YchJ family protein n=1 Tax=unclassified Myroides TaxID=2642485 RepID=UPI003D2F5DAF